MASPERVGLALPVDTEAEVTDVLKGLVVLCFGRGGHLQAAVSRALKAAGAIVMVKTSVADVVRMLGVLVPSVVVIELVSGDPDGPALLEEIRRLPAGAGGGLPVVAVSWETPAPARLLAAGFHGALVGPFDAIDVARTVLRAVRYRTAL